MNEGERNDIARAVSDVLAGKPATLTLEIRPAEDEDEDEHVRLTSLITQLEAFKDVLRHTERTMYGHEGGVYYRVVALSQSSPAMITIEAVPANPRSDYGPALFAQVLENLETLMESAADYMPRELDLPALLAYQNLAPTMQRHVAGLVVRNGKGSITLDDQFGRQVHDAIGPDQITRGDVVGALEVVNLHNKSRFEVYPPIGHRVLCKFPQAKRPDVVAALDKYVRVTGLLHYKRWSHDPHSVEVESIQVLPDEADIPPLESLRGIAPHITDAELLAVRDGLW